MAGDRQYGEYGCAFEPSFSYIYRGGSPPPTQGLSLCDDDSDSRRHSTALSARTAVDAAVAAAIVAAAIVAAANREH